MNDESRIRVLVADDHDVLRLGLSLFLESCDDMLLVGEAADGAEAVELAALAKPDVVLMDLNMPVMDGIEATRRVRMAEPAVRVIVLTNEMDSARLRATLDAGAARHVAKDASTEELARIIRFVAKGAGTPDQAS